jgi:hypothetical protein
MTPEYEMIRLALQAVQWRLDGIARELRSMRETLEPRRARSEITASLDPSDRRAGYSEWPVRR